MSGPSAVTFPLFEVGVEFGSGTLLGVVAGFTMKQLTKVAVVVAAVLLAFLGLLASRDVIEVQWGVLREWIAATAVGTRLPEFLLEVVGKLPGGSGFVIGVVVGFKKG